MLTMYLDESIEQEDGYVVIAGFLGKKSSWVRCARRWRGELGAHKSLHLKTLRGWHTNRNKNLLERLGKVPDSCGLTLVHCSVKVSDYRDLVAGTMVELNNAGYLTALRILVVNVINNLPVGERLEVICEAQPTYAARREILFSLLNSMPEFQDRHGFPKLAKWSSVPKSTLLEASDYACYALLQRLRDAASRRAVLCSPILSGRYYIGGHVSRDQARTTLTSMKAADKDFFEPFTKGEQKDLLRQLGDLTKQL
jgi:hypothetical protein